MDGCYDLPEQVLFGILLCLPVMSLLRFKAVCKSWFSLIESPSFVFEHLNHNRDNKEDNFIILSHVSGQDKINTRKFALLSGSEFEECVYDIDIDIGQFWDSAHEVFLAGYCDGIVCLGHFDRKITLWNPALKQARTLPPPLFADRSLDCTWYKITTSFGIDVKSNDYKLVNILSSSETCKNQVEVYNLGGDDSWRIIHKDDVLPFFDVNTVAAVSSSKRGKCYWIAWHNDLSSNFETSILLSFDFSDDVFTTMLLPNNDVPNNDVYAHSDLDLLDNKVIYFTERTIVNGDRSMEIWMLHEYGAEMSWKLTYKFGPMLDLIYPLRISKSGEFLICGKSNRTAQGWLDESIFYLYNLYTKQGKYHQKCNLEIWSGRIIHYSASLIPLKTAKNARLTK